MNVEQLSVINHDGGPLLVDAGAGSGKTRAVVHRIARLVNDGVGEDRILAVTFSKKAADEMNARLDTLGVREARVGTWHSLAMQILREEDTSQARWTVDDRNRAKILMKRILGHEQMDWKGADLGKITSFIGISKAHLLDAVADQARLTEEATLWFGSALDGKRAVEAMRRLDQAVDAEGLLTFDDFLVFVYRHFRDDEAARERWASRWDYLIQDEAQDANPAQIAIARQLASGHRNYMIVGDIAQSIYSFRGSGPEHLAAFETEWKAPRVAMKRNYRSATAIVAAANNVIANASFRGEPMVAERGVDGSVGHRRYLDLDDEARGFVQWVQGHVEVGGKLADNTALFRTNAQSRALEEALLRAKISYQVVGGVSFYERREVKDLLGYLRVAAGRDQDGDALRRCINAPFRFLGTKFVEKVMSIAAETRPVTIAQWTVTIERVCGMQRIQDRQRRGADDWIELIDYVSKRIEEERKATERSTIADEEPLLSGEVPSEIPSSSRPDAILTHVVLKTRYLAYLRKEEGEESIEQSTVANVNELIRVASKFSSVDELLDYIEKSQRDAKRQRGASDQVLLMSIHRSKGLEWPRVWIVGCCEMILPHARGDEEEERRLFYVAVTRARDELVVSSCRRIALKSGVCEVDQSRFISQAGIK